jgi:hypothetical protein
VSISIAELEGRERSEADYEYIENFGWVLRPLAEGLSDEQGAKTTLVADVHTDGNTKQVLEEGVGYVKLLVAAYMLPDGRTLIGAGPVFSYYEFKWPMSNRLTDEKWMEMLESGTNPPEPDWTKSFVHPVTFLPPNPDDTDNDHLPDSWERSIWRSIELVNDPDDDYDNDGFSNKQEYLAGTDPADAQSRFRVSKIVPQGQGTLLRWSSVLAKRYQIFWSSDLRTWVRSGLPVEAGDQMTDALVPGTNAERQGFYRVLVLP